MKYLTSKKVSKQKYFSLSQLRIQTGKFCLRIWLLLTDEMGLRMKNFNILGFLWKIQLLGGGVHKKLIKRGGLPKKRVLGEFADLRGAWQERGGGLFDEGGWYPNAHYTIFLKKATTFQGFFSWKLLTALSAARKHKKIFGYLLLKVKNQNEIWEFSSHFTSLCNHFENQQPVFLIKICYFDSQKVC